MGVYDEIKATQTPKPKEPPTEGFIWMNILIKYDYKKRTSEVVRCFSRPAKDSTIKMFTKPKKKDEQKPIEMEKTENKTALF